MPLRDDVSDRAEARVGQTLKGKWRLDSVLGIGGMATVYAATHRNRSRVAIKMLHPEVAVSQDVTTRFLREGYVGNAVAHPGTVRVLDDDSTEDGAPFLVMELLEGESLGARLDRDGPLPPTEVAQLAYQLLDVLCAAHAAHIVHRDLKPDNIFLTYEGRVKVLDFGIARLRAAAHESSASTQVGSLLGTPAFMAPEQALGRWKEVDERTDIWAVGATLFTLLTGRFVHEAEAVQEQLVLAATSKAASVQTYAPQTPQWLAQVVDRALAFGRDARYPDARSMQTALRENATGVEFVSYPHGAPGMSGPVPSGVLTPGSLRSSPSVPRPVSSPSFGEGATIVAVDVATPVKLGPSGGTFASVQAVARSAHEPVARPGSKARSLAVGALGFGAVIALAAVVWFVRTPSQPEPGVTLPTAAALPAATARPVPIPPEAASPPETSAKPPSPPASATTRVAANVGKHVVTGKSPPPPPLPQLLPLQLPPLPKPHPNPPEQRENLFDNRH
jgi:eukaryotic-like serine/threonine-protein kinase